MKFITKVLFLSCIILMPHYSYGSSLSRDDLREANVHKGPAITYKDIRHLSPDAFIHPITVNGQVWNLQWHSSIIDHLEKEYAPDKYDFFVQLCDDKGLKNRKIEDLQFASYRIMVQDKKMKKIIDPFLYVFYLRLPK